jgi:2-polyprenyl-3-methyl-5-hydroxy-6-metoxy-1,4-benzoquinol methylase
MYVRGDACPFCGGRKLRPFVAGRTGHRDARPTQLLECCECVVAWQWPLERTAQDSIDHYDDCYRQADSAECSYFHADRRKDVADLQVGFIRQLLGKCEGRLLDVGAGDGVFVHRALAAGFDAYGIEPSPVGANAASVRCGEDRIVCGLLADSATDGKYDVVTLWDVIEHVEDPLSVLMAAAAHLRSDGWLIVETGNYQSAERLLAGNSWWAYHPEHRWYFTPQSMKALFQHAGLNATNICEQTLRPNAPTAINTSLFAVVSSGLRSRAGLLTAVSQYRCLRQAVRAWPAWAHLPIFALAGRFHKCSIPTRHLPRQPKGAMPFGQA